MLRDGGRGKAQRENLGKLGSIVNLGSGCALRINDDSALPKLLKLSKLSKLPKLPILALITGAEGAKRVTRVLQPFMTLLDLYDPLMRLVRAKA